MASATATDTTEKRNVVGTLTISDGPKKLVDRVETLRFVFHNFRGVKQERGDCVTTTPLEAFGYLWRLEFFPKGYDRF